MFLVFMMHKGVLKSCLFSAISLSSPSGLEMGFKVVLQIKTPHILAIQTSKFAFHIPSSSLQSPQQKGLLMAHKC